MISLKLLLISHLIGDFFLQPVSLVKKKNNSIFGLLLHTFIYSLLVIVVLVCFGYIWEIIISILIVVISHFTIDFLRIKMVDKYKNNKFSFWCFIADQIIHISFLIIISFIIGSNYNSIGRVIIKLPCIQLFGDCCNKIFDYILAFSIILVPSSVFIKHLFNYLFNKKEICDDNNFDNVGSLIGMLERILILLLGALGLYASIAIVLTAKSIARFKTIEQDQSFAEKYLVGTLVSLIIAVLSLLIIK